MPVDRCHNIASLQSRSGRSGVCSDTSNTRRRDNDAERHRKDGKEEDRKNKVCNWSRRDDKRSLIDRLEMEISAESVGALLSDHLLAKIVEIFSIRNGGTGICIT